MKRISAVSLISLMVIISGCLKDPTCSDGEKNGSETGVDCGGSCPDCEVTTCWDGIQNGDENGTDCGGECFECLTCPDSISDINGFYYHTKSLGGKCWTLSNLRVINYNDGVQIPDNQWGYSSNNSNLEQFYGKLYTNAVANSGKLCPEGWHIPSEQEWEDLIASQGGEDIAGGNLKSTSILWDTPNEGATNTSGFSALPAGSTSISFGPGGEGELAYFWTTTEGFQDGQGLSFGLWNENAEVNAYSFPNYMQFSCRCVQD